MKEMFSTGFSVMRVFFSVVINGNVTLQTFSQYMNSRMYMNKIFTDLFDNNSLYFTHMFLNEY